MGRFLSRDYSQNMMINVNNLDQLQVGTFEYALVLS